MIVCHNPKFVFIRNPKTASRSIVESLKSQFQIWECSEHHEWRIPEPYAGFYAFLFVRNPFSRCVSAWNHVCKDRIVHNNHEPLSFKRFLEIGVFKTASLDLNFFKQTEMVSQIRGKIKILKYESLHKEINSLPFMNKKVEVPHIGKSEGDWITVYDRTTERMVAELLAEDFENFGYPRALNIKLP